MLYNVHFTSFSNAWKDDEWAGAQQFFIEGACGQNSPVCISYLSMWLALDSQGSQTGMPWGPVTKWRYGPHLDGAAAAPITQFLAHGHRVETRILRFFQETLKSSFLCKDSWSTCEISPDLNIGNLKQHCVGQRTLHLLARFGPWPFRLQPLPWMLYPQISMVK